MKRRAWLLGSAAATGALVVGWGFIPARSRLGAGALMLPEEGHVALNGWIKIAYDGAVVLAMPRSEMGQGVHTALPMLAAEELDVPLARVRIEQAGADAIYGNVAMLFGNLPLHPQDEEREDGFGRAKAARWIVGKVGRELGINATGGSSSVADAWDVVRAAAATARASLLGAASLQWRLPVADLAVVDGVVSHPSGRSIGYGALARFAAATPPGKVSLKARENWRLIGHAAPRLDVPDKVNGRATYGIDVRLPGMRFAAIRLCPILGGATGRVDAGAALAMPGVERLVMLRAYAGSAPGFAVVARTSWHAMRAAQAVEVEWRPGTGDTRDSRKIEAMLRQALLERDGYTFHERGNIEQARTVAASNIDATYAAPYLAHLTLEPMNATARVRDGVVDLWLPTQVPQMCRDAAARVAGVPSSRVNVHVTLLGGGFGRRLEVDYAAYAVRVAMDCGGAPVQLLWPREEDTRHDFFRPMQVAALSAWFDRESEPTALSIRSAGDAISPRWFERALPRFAGPVDLPDKTASEGLFDLPYAFAHQRIAHVATRMDVPVGFWRSVGHSHNAFFSECFVDEVAHRTGLDPVEMRRRLLRDAPRHLAVLSLAAEKARWGTPLPAGRAHGIALHESFGSVVAEVVELSLSGGRVRVHRVTCAIDCGTVVNPAIVAQQMESSVVFGASAALHGRIDIEGGRVIQGNFPTTPLLRLAAAPQVETWIVKSERTPGGVGEPGVPPVAPAIANALFALTGQRRRTLPLEG
ncbi:molybdopterin cofactor-binding domain-containing protein [Ramlibacter sp.]|uniref:xanthine dehydrogenase family protein molybdopterin-binding subunit n=1 Tax=Ramlibacter sp. TaxID=1917967 RepID=UPI003D0F5228